jgi:hypothetical protein
MMVSVIAIIATTRKRDSTRDGVTSPKPTVENVTTTK